MKNTKATPEEKVTGTPSVDDQPSHSTSIPESSDRQLTVRPSGTPDPIERLHQQTQGLDASLNEFEHRMWEMETNLSHQFATMQSKLDSSFSSLHDEISDLGDTLDKSMDRLENTVDRFVSLAKWHIAFAALAALAGVAFLIWQIFGP